jgi:hypothetical protein
VNAEHFAAVKARIEVNADLAGKVEDTYRGDIGALAREAYVVLYGGSPDRLGVRQRLTEAQLPTSSAEWVYTARSVGPDADTARRLSGAVSAQLTNAVLTIAGRRCEAIRFGLGGDVVWDRSVTPPLPYIDDEYHLVTHPA